MWPTLPNENTDFSAKASGESIRLQVSHPIIAELDSDLFYFFPINEYFGHTLNQVFNFDKENGALSWNMPLNTEISPPTELSGVLRHPSLRSGWNVTWKMNEVQYGTSVLAVRRLLHHAAAAPCAPRPHANPKHPEAEHCLTPRGVRSS